MPTGSSRSAALSQAGPAPALPRPALLALVMQALHASDEDSFIGQWVELLRTRKSELLINLPMYASKVTNHRSCIAFKFTQSSPARSVLNDECSVQCDDQSRGPLGHAHRVQPVRRAEPGRARARAATTSAAGPRDASAARQRRGQFHRSVGGVTPYTEIGITNCKTMNSSSGVK
ncbi:hypothetical protein KGM_207433 [Danaus plexippus plexippus]|uniref:Uncharacterized protein n=1 Tax=Danaus plexippus plexippus TaxID=278856 RepID=A0A212FKC0_DANPL|nr:hypothetical protein KGM_207433 [Danaus plexippus plexippus]